MFKSTFLIVPVLAATVAVAQPAAPAAPAAKPAAPPAAAPAAPPAAAPAAPAAKSEPPKVVPSLKPDKEGYCQNTEFVGWSKEGGEAAYSESYCKQPPPDQAYDTLYLVTRDGRIKRWLIGAEAAATMKVDTRGKLLFGEAFRKAGGKAPDGKQSATVKIEGDYVMVTFATTEKDAKAPAPVSRDLKLPYPGWENAAPAAPGDIFWSPDSGALAVTVKATKKEPAGGKLAVSSVYFIQIAPLQAAAPTGAMPPGAPGAGGPGVPTFRMPPAAPPAGQPAAPAPAPAAPPKTP